MRWNVAWVQTEAVWRTGGRRAERRQRAGSVAARATCGGGRWQRASAVAARRRVGSASRFRHITAAAAALNGGFCVLLAAVCQTAAARKRRGGAVGRLGALARLPSGRGPRRSPLAASVMVAAATPGPWPRAGSAGPRRQDDPLPPVQDVDPLRSLVGCPCRPNMCAALPFAARRPSVADMRLLARHSQSTASARPGGESWGGPASRACRRLFWPAWVRCTRANALKC